MKNLWMMPLAAVLILPALLTTAALPARAEQHDVTVIFGVS